mmetsp:Transcript_1136/g.7397  ORF Transcript_1136/g.7397 Transcript_1136/m.7397 type:complete len:100 (+) Transcript_1136:485-784(+)
MKKNEYPNGAVPFPGTIPRYGKRRRHPLPAFCCPSACFAFVQARSHVSMYSFFILVNEIDAMDPEKRRVGEVETAICLGIMTLPSPGDQLDVRIFVHSS